MADQLDPKAQAEQEAGEGAEEVLSTKTFIDDGQEENELEKKPDLETKPDSESEPEVTPQGKTIKKLLSRIDDITGQKHATARERDDARLELDILRVKIEVLEAAGKKLEDIPEKPLTQADVERRAREMADQEVRATNFTKLADTVYASGQKEFGKGNFDASLENFKALGEPGQIFPLVEAVMEEEFAQRILYHLGNNLNEAEELLKLPPVKLGRALARLGDKVAKAPKISKAATPIEPVEGGEAGDPPLEKTRDLASWMAKRDAEEAAQRRH